MTPPRTPPANRPPVLLRARWLACAALLAAPAAQAAPSLYSPTLDLKLSYNSPAPVQATKPAPFNFAALRTDLQPGSLTLAPPPPAAPRPATPPHTTAAKVKTAHTNIYDYTGLDPDGFNTFGNYINDAVGATRFYSTGVYDNDGNVVGIFGQDTYTIHVDAGHPWAGPGTHSTLSGVDPSLRFNATDAMGNPLTVTAPQAHPTQIAMVIAGAGGELRDTGTTNTIRVGIAPFTHFGSGAIATSVADDNSGSFAITAKTFLAPFKHFAEATFTRPITYPLGGGITFQVDVAGPTDVINASFGFDDPAGISTETIAVDALARLHPKTAFVVSAGNSGPDANTVGGPGSGYNVITVGATGDGTVTGLNKVADFSSRGAQDFALNPALPANQRVLHGVRAPVDLVAPGVFIVMATYNGPGTDPDAAVAASGTSFSAPIVSSGVALLDSLSYHLVETVTYTTPGQNWDASRDARVIKAVLMNSATKLPGWNNGQSVQNNVRGHDNVTRTGQALDLAQGAGTLNLDRAQDQYLGGTVDPFGFAGLVQKRGWSLNAVTLGGTKDYIISEPLTGGQVLDATLVWFRNRALPTIDDATDDWDPATSDPTLIDLGMANLYLEVWDASQTHLLATSDTDYNTVQHLHYTLPDDGLYVVRVNYAAQLFGQPDPAGETFALAWDVTEQVPEPGVMCVLGASTMLALFRRSRSRAA